MKTWNAACRPALAAGERLFQYNLRAPRGVDVCGWLARQEGELSGFVWAAATSGEDPDLPHPRGWVEALAVQPQAQGQGIGTRLLELAETWLHERGVQMARLGGGINPFAPGLPVELYHEGFFQRRGYQRVPGDEQTWDVARQLEGYESPNFVRRELDQVRPLRPEEAPVMEAFLCREFPGRWTYEFHEVLRTGERLSDFLGLWDGEGLQGFCRLTFEDSPRPVERFYLNRLPRPWGQLGPIGVSSARRGEGLGSTLLDGGLRHLRSRGVNGCVIDWTRQVGFYQRFGFRPHRAYWMFVKAL